MIQKPKKFLVASFICLILLCIVVFLWVSVRMSQRSEGSITEIGSIYMAEMNRQIEQKFSAIMDLRLSQVQGIIDRTPPETTAYGEEMLSEMTLSAEIRNFTYLALYTPDGESEILLGDGSIEIIQHDSFMESLNKGSNKIGSGYDQNGERLLVMGVDADYEMSGGRTSTALVAALPMQQLEQELVLDGENSLMYTHVIYEDGSFVIRTGSAYRDNYFDRIREEYRDFGEMTAEEHVRELQSSIAAKRNYSSLVLANEMSQHIYCSPLPDSDWYLVSIMPVGILDNAVNTLGNERIRTMFGACALIMAAIVVIFILYYGLSQRQMKQLDSARADAIRANKAKSEFLSNMSHDIRTPMNGIVGMTAIAVANIQDQARVQDCLKKIMMSSKHLLGLINDVLDMSKIESGKLSLNINQLSLREAMSNIVNIVQPQVYARQQHFDIFIQKIETEEVLCDSVRLNQILINLLSNAIKFTPEGGTINVYLSQEESPLGADFVRCHFWVRDTGIGMSPEFQKEIFDTFSREKSSNVDKVEGTGLGMAITKSIVDAMDGTIELKSAPGEGSEFHITLDLERAVIPEKDMQLPPWKMLVVDNNEDLCQSAVETLKEIGVEAEWAVNGRTALEMVRRRHAEHDDYEVVLLDWKMPDMNGLQATREIRECVGEGIPILIISAYDWSDIEEDARQAGARGFISKPLFKSNLYLGLSQLIEGGEEEPEKKDEENDSFAGKKILLAEDNELNWEIAEDILTEAGFEVDWAENGKLCIEMFEASEIGHYDIILMDIRMPVMGGYEAAERIRAMERADKDLPIFAMTADAFSDDIQHCLACGMNEHVAKPIDVQRLTQLLRKYLK
ncbi:MAG: response regulator [Lachnospiraceae bacterium]|nr:response regulator [Lachnospiraceae bacterium]